MKKAARLNDMIIFLNDKKFFSLKNIMDKYGISKSTALRDIQSLEEIGMPIYSTVGRNGCYGILPNRLLSPIIFTVDEVFALYFAMLTLKAYQSSPFHLNIPQLKQKFEGCISEERKQKLRKMELIFSLGSYQSKNECSYLRDILSMAVNEQACEVGYTKGGAEKQYHVQFFDITSAYGQWYATAYNFETNKPQVFRCDKIHFVEACDKHHPKPLSELLVSPKEMFRDETAIDFEVEISTRAADLFYKEHYPSMAIHYDHEKCYIRGFYNKGEEAFIAGYFIAYGESVLSIHPAGLKELMLERLKKIEEHFEGLS